MSLTREMRKSLETSLNQGTLDFLTEKFRTLEECLVRIKEYEVREFNLLERIAEKDEMIWQLLQKHAAGSPVGFQQQPYQYPSYNNDFNRGIYSQGRGRGGRQGGGQQGGGQQGQGGQGGGGRGTTSEIVANLNRGGYVPPVERPVRRYIPSEQPEVTPVYKPFIPSEEGLGTKIETTSEL